MATVADTITVTTTAAVVAAAGDGAKGYPSAHALKAPSGNTEDVLIGGSGVDATDFYPLAPGDSIGIDLITSSTDEDVYAVVAAGTETLHVLSTNQ